MSYKGLLYHEKQLGSLCGLHCVNALLQGPEFSIDDFIEISKGIDEKERSIMAEAGNTEDFRRFVSEGSHNISMAGDFNFPVMSEALSIHDLKVYRWTSPDMIEARQNPAGEQGFICNLGDHWLAVRKVFGSWFNFNSIYPAPEPLSEFYLSAFLSTLESEGYTIFVVKGRLRDPVPDPYNPNYKRAQVRMGARATRVNEADDPELAAVIAASLLDAGPQRIPAQLQQLQYQQPQQQPQQPQPMDTEDEELQRALQMSMEESRAHPSPQPQRPLPVPAPPPQPQQQQQPLYPSPQPQLPQQPQQQLRQGSPHTASPVPQQQQQQQLVQTGGVTLGAEATGDDSMSIAVRLASGTRTTRRFSKHDPAQSVYDWVSSCEPVTRRFLLVSAFPRVVLRPDGPEIAAQLGQGSASLIVELQQ